MYISPRNYHCKEYKKRTTVCNMYITLSHKPTNTCLQAFHLGHTHKRNYLCKTVRTKIKWLYIHKTKLQIIWLTATNDNKIITCFWIGKNIYRMLQDWTFSQEPNTSFVINYLSLMFTVFYSIGDVRFWLSLMLSVFYFKGEIRVYHYSFHQTRKF